MASTVASLSTPATLFAAADVLPPRKAVAGRVWFPLARRGSGGGGGGFAVRSTGPATPPEISDKVSESIKKAEETCAEENVSGECAAAWDEVEELSAAASHARDKLKEDGDALESYCKDNAGTDECRTYDN